MRLPSGQSGWASATFLENISSNPPAPTTDDNDLYTEIDPDKVSVPTETVEQIPRYEEVAQELLAFNPIKTCQAMNNLNLLDWGRASIVHDRRLIDIGVSDEGLALIDLALNERGHYLTDILFWSDRNEEMPEFCNLRLMGHHAMK